MADGGVCGMENDDPPGGTTSEDAVMVQQAVDSIVPQDHGQVLSASGDYAATQVGDQQPQITLALMDSAQSNASTSVQSAVSFAMADHSQFSLAGGVTMDSNHVIQLVGDQTGGALPVGLTLITPQQLVNNQVVLDTGGTEAANTMEPVSVLDPSALQNLLASPATLQLSQNGEIRIIALAGAKDLGSSGKMWQVLPAVNTSGEQYATIIAINPDAQQQENGECDPSLCDTMIKSEVLGVEMLPPPNNPMPAAVEKFIQKLPPGCPTWAGKLRDCEEIGDSYRGWVESEQELDLLLTYHKQQTQTFWGTRQSPSPAKPSIRLMWKSQYVPFDGLPFINSGSRAVVMECQYGPRRKGSQLKKATGSKINFTQTCPARVYIKRVRKFPNYAVDVHEDKKNLKLAMDKAFTLLKDLTDLETTGQERWYVQLPTEKGHEFHGDIHINEPQPAILPDTPCRLHPRVTEKIREMVSGGETRLYVIRKALRKFVERELFESSDHVPEKHNLTFYPTVNDLQNHIHQAIKDIEAGILPLNATTLNVEVQCGDPSSQGLSWADDQPHAETVTVTLTQNPLEDGHHIISRVETHLSDGSTRVSTNLTPETAQLLSKLHPNMFPAGSLFQLQAQQTPLDQLDDEAAVQQMKDEYSLGEDMDSITEAEAEVNEGVVLHSHEGVDDKDSELDELSQAEQHRLCVSQFQGIVSVVSEPEGTDGDNSLGIKMEMTDNMTALTGTDTNMAAGVHTIDNTLDHTQHLQGIEGGDDPIDIPMTSVEDMVNSVTTLVSTADVHAMDVVTDSISEHLHDDVDVTGDEKFHKHDCITSDDV